jgi:glutaminyl-tRNA synthetase
VRGEDGEVAELRGEIVPETRAGQADEGYRAKGVLHWVSAAEGVPATFRLYDRLFSDPAPDALDDFHSALNPHSLAVTQGVVEPHVRDLPPDTRVQFERLGYFWPDPVDSRPGALVFNRIVGLRDSWGKQQARSAPDAAPAAAARPAPRSEPAAGTQSAPFHDPAADLHGQARAWFDALSEQGVGAEDAAVLAQDDALRDLYEALVAVHSNARLAGAFVVSDLRRVLAGRTLAETCATSAELGILLRLVDEGTVTRTAARDVLTELVETGGHAEAIVQARGLAAITDDAALSPHVEAVLADFPGKVAEYRTGKTGLLGFFTGETMRRAGRGADPKRVQELLRVRLG